MKSDRSERMSHNKLDNRLLPPSLTSLLNKNFLYIPNSTNFKLHKTDTVLDL